ncbi:MAG TPA: cytochrome P450 [Steroidobacteraceae bacterium]|nr:cytochrome P450 [Steroidobacteraceae bacterium]
MPELPESSVDLYSDEILEQPYEFYRDLRNSGPVVYLARYGFYAVPRFADVRAVLTNWQDFSSAQGIAMNEPMNHALMGTVIATDPPEHKRLRRILEKPIAAKEVVALRQRMTRQAEGLAQTLVRRGEFDVATDLAQFLPLTVVSELVGLPEEGRQKMLSWAAAAFDGAVPLNVPRTEEALRTMGEMVAYTTDATLAERVRPNGWAAGLYHAAQIGELTRDQASAMMQGYLTPSLDTTIFATTNLIWLFAQNPGQWEELRRNPELVPRAINEAIRLESPIQHFSRVATGDVSIEGAPIPAGARVLVMYGSANRDERHYDVPERFDIHRSNNDHLGFGHANHMCAGMNLAKLELTALVEALLPRVSRFELLRQKRSRNNLLRGFEQLQVRVHH